MLRHIFLLAVVATACTSAAQSNERTASDTGRIPARHRIAGETCSPVSPASNCSACAGCTDGTVCTEGKHICTCRSDACSNDSQCASGGVCACRTQARDARGFNICLTGNCRIDADCGAAGYCSPTWDLSCGESNGVVGYYCHTARDACVDDADCVDAGKVGYCAWSADRWKCAYAVCL